MKNTNYSTDLICTLWEQLSGGNYFNISDDPLTIKLIRNEFGSEGLLFTFNGKLKGKLKKSSGFSIECSTSNDQTTLVITKNPGQDTRMFGIFIANLLSLCATSSDCPSAQQFDLIIKRIAAWQSFMKTRDNKFSPEKEVGLFGELCILRLILTSQIPYTNLTDLWRGSQRGSHDFVFDNNCELEVKTSLEKNPFIAHIESLEQLDSCGLNKLHLAAIHIIKNESGVTVRTLAEEIKNNFLPRSDVFEFESLLIAYGLTDEIDDSKLRKFEKKDCCIFCADDLPRLTKLSVPGIFKAQYDILLTKESGEKIFPSSPWKDYSSTLLQ